MRYEMYLRHIVWEDGVVQVVVTESLSEISRAVKITSDRRIEIGYWDDEAKKFVRLYMIAYDPVEKCYRLFVSMPMDWNVYLEPGLEQSDINKIIMSLLNKLDKIEIDEVKPLIEKLKVALRGHT